MQLVDLVRLASKGYEQDFPEACLLDQLNESGIPFTAGEYARRRIGDSLGRFVVIELYETYDPEASDKAQIEEAIRVMEAARTNLDNVIKALEDARP